MLKDDSLSGFSPLLKIFTVDKGSELKIRRKNKDFKKASFFKRKLKKGYVLGLFERFGY